MKHFVMCMVYSVVCRIICIPLLSAFTNEYRHVQTMVITCLIISPFGNGPRREKPYLRGVANTTGADQPAHPRSLISAFVNRVFESTISKLATSEISVF